MQHFFPRQLKSAHWECLASELSPRMSPSPRFWKRRLRGESVGLSVPRESCIPPYSPPFPCGKQKRIYSDMGAERRKGMGKRCSCELGAVEAKGRSPDFGPWIVFWLYDLKSGVVLWELTVELGNVFAPFPEIKPSHEPHEETQSMGCSYLALLTYPASCKKLSWIMESCGLEGISGSYPVPTPCSNQAQ